MLCIIAAFSRKTSDAHPSASNHEINQVIMEVHGMKKYEEFGFCKSRYPEGNGFRNRWKRNNSGFGYMPSACDETVKETLEDYLRC